MSDASPTTSMSNAQGRRARARIYLIANALLLTLIVLMVNYLAFRHYKRWDWTEESLFTLSDRSERVLAELKQPVEVWVMVGENEPEHAELRTLVDRYRAASDRISVHFVDPYRNPGAYMEAVRRFRLREGERETREGIVRTTEVALVVVAGQRQWEIGREDVVSHSLAEGDEQRVQLNVEGERALTGAILEVTEGRPTKMCFTTGHGEIPLDGGLSELTAELRRENVDYEAIETRGRTEIPASCDALAIVGPNVAFDEREAELVREYVRGGGNLLLAIDPVPDADQRRVVPTGLEPALRDFGIRVSDEIVVEPNRAMMPPGQGHPVILYFANDFGEHAITAPFRDVGMPVLVAEARSVRPVEEGSASVLLRASEASYGEPDLTSLTRGEMGEAGPGDLPGPVSIAVASQVEVHAEANEGDDDEQDRAGGRVVVLGDATLLARELLAAPGAINLPFVGAAIGWLTEREAMISIPARTVKQPPMPSEADVANLFFRVVVLIPLAFVFLGIAVWWNRRL